MGNTALKKDVDNESKVSPEEFREALQEDLGSRSSETKSNGPELPPIKLSPTQEKEEADKAIRRRDDEHAMKMRREQAEVDSINAKNSLDRKHQRASVIDNRVGGALGVALIVLAGFGMLLGVKSLGGPSE